MSYLLDTNIVTAALKENQIVSKKLGEVRRQGQQVFISCMTNYEIKRGLLANNASKKMLQWDNFCRIAIDEVIFVPDMEIIEKASEIYADLKRRGLPIQDADIIIAATAIIHNLILVSNDSDLLRVQGLTLENWIK